MKMQYVFSKFSKQEIKAVRARLKELKWVALMNRDAKDAEANREFYLMAKGFEEALVMLGIVDEEGR